MNQLTLRGFDKEVERAIRELARRERTSLNQAALHLLRRGAGLDESGPSERTVGDSLDHLIGTWSDEEADELNRAVADFAQVDEEVWR